MTRRLVLAMAVLVAVVAVALAVPMARDMANDNRRAFISSLEVDTLSTAAALSAQPRDRWQETAEAAALRTGARVVVVDPNRSLVADSDQSGLDRLFDRPEVNAALAGSLTSDVRASSTLGEDLRYVAAPVVQDLGVVAAVRLSLPESTVSEEVARNQRWLVAFVLSVVVAAALVAWLVARSIASPLRRLATVAHTLPDDLDQRADESSGPPEVREVAQGLNTTAARLSGILHRTQRVAADASHHLRTPLTGVRLRLEAIEDLTDQPEVQAEAVAATSEVDRLTRRIEQVLALARADAASERREREDLSAVVSARVEIADPMFEERGIALTSSIEPDAIVLAPHGLVARIVDELLGNALQYARTCVHVGVSRNGRRILLTVEDDGPGLPDDEREAVFQRFTRGSTSQPGGSGLGLALVRESVEGIGGGAEAGESRWGGFLVRVWLPV